MKKFSRGLILNSLNLFSHQLKVILKIFLEVTIKNESVPFAPNYSRIKSDIFHSKSSSYLEKNSNITFISRNHTQMPSKKNIAKVQFIDSLRPANPLCTPRNSSRTAHQPANSPISTRTANPPPIPTTQVYQYCHQVLALH